MLYMQVQFGFCLQSHMQSCFISSGILYLTLQDTSLMFNPFRSSKVAIKKENKFETNSLHL